MTEKEKIKKNLIRYFEFDSDSELLETIRAILFYNNQKLKEYKDKEIYTKIEGSYGLPIRNNVEIYVKRF